MAITLNAEQERLIAQVMQAGGYQNADDVIARALEILRAEDGFLQRGEFLSAEESRSDMEQRKANWLRDQPR
jgi:Arc/MetJ-type ribon-helix-helix transcriptional regulator